jgi:hypothetical protein
LADGALSTNTPEKVTDYHFLECLPLKSVQLTTLPEALKYNISPFSKIFYYYRA